MEYRITRSIIVPIVFSKKGGKIENSISSIYGRNAEYNFAIKQILDKNALYVSTKKGPDWAKRSRVQFPRTLLKQSLSLELSIAKEKGIVNGKNNIGRLYQMAGQKALTANQENLQRAMAMWEEAKSQEEIFKETG